MVTFQHFSKEFGAVQAVRSLTTTIGAGEVVALLGPNGSGKTTSIKAAAGLIWPTSGTVLLGHPGRSAMDPVAREICSFLPQRVAFPEALTGREVVDFYGGLRSGPQGRTAEIMRLTALNGASTRPVGTYSGGMRQRLALAVAMLPDAPVLLLDEPTASLDPDGLQMFYALVDRRRRRGQTVLFSSHQMGDVERLADRFLVLVNGLLAASFTAKELADRLAARGVMRLAVDRLPDGLLERARTIAPLARWEDDQLVVSGNPHAQLAVLDLVRGAGMDIRGLTVEEGRLESFYLDLVGRRS
jgi:Cu-processing system ATP-binding protein